MMDFIFSGTAAVAARLLFFSVASVFSVVSTSAYASEDHSRHQMPQHQTPQEAPVQKPLPESPVTDVVIYPPPTPTQLQAAFPDLGDRVSKGHMSDQYYGKLMLDRLESQYTDEGRVDAHAALVWDANAWWGSDIDKLNVRSEGKHADGTTEQLETQLFWRHAVARWWDTSLGVRHDGGSGPDRSWIAFGVQGLAPYFFEVDALAYIGESGHTAFNLEAEYELLLTNRLILQPRLEVSGYGKADEARGIGKGFSDSEFGLRLRYEIYREVAPYLGVEWSRRYGDTADMARAAGEPASDVKAVAGIRLWY